jgi:hypothetical protein
LPWVIAAIAVLVATVLATRFRRPEGSSALATLVAASGPEARTIEPRLSGGFAWAPFQANVRGASGPASVPVIGANVADLRGERSPETRHTVGLLELLSGKTSSSISKRPRF